MRWYKLNARNLPWRQTDDPYRILVSEIMLQQTRVETVQTRYEPFLRQFPDVRSLAAADETEVLKAWEGLGYYRRARNLHAAAKTIVERWDGRLPEDADLLRTIPGIGPYTSAAVAAIAFGRPCAAVDANVVRILTRVFRIQAEANSSEARHAIQEAADACLPACAPGDYAQALMDLGSLVCVPGVPICGKCPVETWCRARAAGEEQLYPVRKPKRDRREECWTAFAILWGGTVALVRRSGGLLDGLFAFPAAPGTLSADDAAAWVQDLGMTSLRITEGPVWKHAFTHVVWSMTSFLVRVETPTSAFIWADAGALREKYAVPSAYRPLLLNAEAKIA